MSIPRIASSTTMRSASSPSKSAMTASRIMQCPMLITYVLISVLTVISLVRVSYRQQGSAEITAIDRNNHVVLPSHLHAVPAVPSIIPSSAPFHDDLKPVGDEHHSSGSEIPVSDSKVAAGAVQSVEDSDSAEGRARTLRTVPGLHDDHKIDCLSAADLQLHNEDAMVRNAFVETYEALVSSGYLDSTCEVWWLTDSTLLDSLRYGRPESAEVLGKFRLMSVACLVVQGSDGESELSVKHGSGFEVLSQTAETVELRMRSPSATIPPVVRLTMYVPHVYVPGASFTNTTYVRLNRTSSRPYTHIEEAFRAQIVDALGGSQAQEQGLIIYLRGPGMKMIHPRVVFPLRQCLYHSLGWCPAKPIRYLTLSSDWGNSSHCLLTDPMHTRDRLRWTPEALMNHADKLHKQCNTASLYPLVWNYRLHASRGDHGICENEDLRHEGRDPTTMRTCTFPNVEDCFLPSGW